MPPGSDTPTFIVSLKRVKVPAKIRHEKLIGSTDNEILTNENGNELLVNGRRTIRDTAAKRGRKRVKSYMQMCKSKVVQQMGENWEFRLQRIVWHKDDYIDYSTWDRILHTHMPANMVPKCTVPPAVLASVQSKMNRCAAWPASATIPRKFYNDIVSFECPRHMLHYTLTNVNPS